MRCNAKPCTGKVTTVVTEPHAGFRYGYCSSHARSVNRQAAWKRTGCKVEKV